jgi:pyruvate/2-oxoglutarate dehydrogenase complex dihydrolipoamide dehydrogenase (E3) component
LRSASRYDSRNARWPLPELDQPVPQATLSLGKTPNTNGIGLERARIKLTASGYDV